jgi:hypothetical protein
MWFCFRDAYLSIVAHEREPALLLVRARRPGDIENVFPYARVIETPGRDYLFRAEVPRDEVSRVIGELVFNMRATNFKSSVRDKDLHSAYTDVWRRMAKLQPVPPYGGRAAPARTR